VDRIEAPHPDEDRNVEIPVRWKRREYGGWNLVHAETGRILGWITRGSVARDRTWQVRLSSIAFRGESPTDTGDVMDSVPYWLYDGQSGDPFVSCVHSNTRDRWEAAYDIVQALVSRRAPAVGFGRHPEVDTSRSDRYHALMGATA